MNEQDYPMTEELHMRPTHPGDILRDAAAVLFVFWHNQPQNRRAKRSGVSAPHRTAVPFDC